MPFHTHKGKKAKNKIVRLTKQVRMMKPELKLYAYTSNCVPTTTAQFIPFNLGLIQGTSSATRVGDRVRATKLYLRMNVTYNEGDQAVTLVRAMVLKDNMLSSTATNPPTLTTAPSAVLDEGNVYSAMSIDTRQRYKVIKDFKMIHAPPQAIGSTTALSVSSSCGISTVYWSKKVNFSMQFQGNAGTGADLSKGTVWLFLLSNQTTYAPVVDYYVGLEYVDD